MDADKSTELLKNADMALYDAKADGPRNIPFFEPEMNTRMKVRRALEMDLRRRSRVNNSNCTTSPSWNWKRMKINGFRGAVALEPSRRAG